METTATDPKSKPVAVAGMGSGGER